MSNNFDDSPELNITPLIDVMLVLLAILMVTAPTMVYEEIIQLPKGSKSAQQNKNSKIEIRITKDKNIFIQKNIPRNMKTFFAKHFFARCHAF